MQVPSSVRARRCGAFAHEPSAAGPRGFTGTKHLIPLLLSLVHPVPIPSIQGGNDAPCQERRSPAAPLHISCTKPCRNRSPLLQPCLQDQILKRTALGSRNTFFCQLDCMANDPAQAGCTTRRKLSQRWQKQRSHGEISHCFPSSHCLLMRRKETEIIRSSGVNVYLY